jgi:hypothetical protein
VHARNFRRLAKRVRQAKQQAAERAAAGLKEEDDPRPWIEKAVSGAVHEC